MTVFLYTVDEVFMILNPLLLLLGLVSLVVFIIMVVGKRREKELEREAS